MPVRIADEAGLRLSRRDVLISGAGVATALSGCISTSPTPPGQEVEDRTERRSSNVELLKTGGSSTIYTFASEAASYWSANFPPSNEEYWGPDQYGIQTNERFADYWAGKYGFESRGEGPPFEVSVGLSNTGTGLEKLRQGHLDIANATAPVELELEDLSEDERAQFTAYVVGVDAPRFVVSTAIFEAGVDRLTADQLTGIYEGEITDWTQIDHYEGPEREIQAIGRTAGSATETLFRANLMGSKDAEMPGVDVRRGESQEVKTIVINSNNAIGYMSMGFVDEQTPPIAVAVGDDVFQPGVNLSDPDYPLSRDMYSYTYGGTSKMAAAFLRLLLSDFGQEVFVEPAGYSTLTDERQEEELGRLPEPNA